MVPIRTVTVRTITMGIADPHPVGEDSIRRGVETAGRIAAACSAAGHDVQTVRLATRPVFEDLADATTGEILDYVRRLDETVRAAGGEYCSVGPAPAFRTDFPLETLEIIPELIGTTETVSCSAQVGTHVGGMRTAATHAVAHVIKALATQGRGGMDNFRFAAVACVPPGVPFFPAAYHFGPASVTVGLQGAGIVAEALKDAGLAEVAARVTAALRDHAGPVAALMERTADAMGIRYGGIDLSPAPAGAVSIVAALEQCGRRFGGPGTLALAEAVTRGLRGTGLFSCGFNGLMLPVLEDETLAERWRLREVDADRLLQYSAICGTGLDTLPLPGDVDARHIAGLVQDVAALAVRLDKPLSARLFPVPGKGVGEQTAFHSRYLVETVI